MADIKHVSWMVLPFCWLFMSIMFPFIFAMSLRNLGEQTKIWPPRSRSCPSSAAPSPRR